MNAGKVHPNSIQFGVLVRELSTRIGLQGSRLRVQAFGIRVCDQLQKYQGAAGDNTVMRMQNECHCSNVTCCMCQMSMLTVATTAVTMFQMSIAK